MNDNNKEYLDKILREFHSLIDFYRMEYDEDLLPLFQDLCYLLIGRACYQREQDSSVKHDYLKMTSEEVEEWVYKFQKEIWREMREADWYRDVFEYQLFIEKTSILRQILQVSETLLDICNKVEDEDFCYKAVRGMYELCVCNKRNSERYVLPDIYVKIFAQILDLEKNSDRGGEKLSILDPQAGTGTVLIATGQYWPKAVLRGYESDRQLRIGVQLLSILSGKRIYLEKRDFLPKGAEKAYDIVFANPSFTNTKERLSTEIQIQMPIRVQTRYGFFLVQSVLALASGGMAVLVVPDSFLFSTKAEFVDIRRWMFTEYSIEAIVSLPKSTFHFSTVKSSVLLIKNFKTQASFFMKEEWNERHPYVFFYDLEAESDGNLIDIWNQREYLFEQWREKTENFLENYNLIRTPGNWEFQEFWFAERKSVEVSGWNLLPEYYKPAKRQVLDFEDPQQILEDLIQKQKELLSDMEELLVEVRGL